MSFNVRISVIACLACWLASSALAQTPASTRIRGTIAALDGQTMTVTTREGADLPIALTEPVIVTALKAVEFAAIQPGAYVGVTAEPGADGKLQAIAVYIFPEERRGVGEGHRE